MRHLGRSYGASDNREAGVGGGEVGRARGRGGWRRRWSTTGSYQSSAHCTFIQEGFVSLIDTCNDRGERRHF